MGDPFEIGVRRRVAGDHYSDDIDRAAATALAKTKEHPLDGAEARKILRKLLDWFYFERTKQADNRLQMAMDADFYDGIQWDPEDAAVVESRGQMPLVFNEIAPMVDWLIGTERRTRVDWRVLPRSEDDVELADVKTKVLKYVSDINRVAFNRSRAFAQAVKVGVGWLDDGARDDPTQDILYSKCEDWRNVLWDSSSYELDLSDARYLFRWRWVDADIAEMMFPKRGAQIRRAVVDAGTMDDADDDFYLGESIQRGGSMYATSAGVYGEASRRRIRLIEAQFRMPAQVKIVAAGPMKGAHFSENDIALAQYLGSNPAAIMDRVMMRTHVAVFTETDLLALSPSIYRHNQFSLTPIWCYRRDKDRMPYGAIRRVRDIQNDLNKRASKALFMLNTNQIIADKGAVDDVNVARDEADRPDGYIEKKPNSEFTIKRDTDAATGQIQMMTLDAQTIQRSVGVNNENLGRQTNAASGEAIKARQLQGSVSTTEPFDNNRYAIQVQGSKQLSLVEQFYAEEKVIRLTGSKGALDWVRINQPEQQPDGSVRYLNDITASQADFVVSEQDYAGTLRQVLLDGIAQMAQRMPDPMMALRMYIIGMEFSDMPNKDEVAEEMRRAIGERDPNKELTPEEVQQQEQQMAAQAEAMAMQREQAALALEEQRAKVAKLNAEAQAIIARADGGEGMAPDVEAKFRQVQESAQQQLEAMAEQLRKVQMDSSKEIMRIKNDADVRVEVARIDAAAKERVAEITAGANGAMDEIMRRLDELSQAAGTNTGTEKGDGDA